MQWNALNATGVCSSSSAHRRFQEWEQAGVFHEIWRQGLLEYDEVVGIDWSFLSGDGAMSKSPQEMKPRAGHTETSRPLPRARPRDAAKKRAPRCIAHRRSEWREETTADVCEERVADSTSRTFRRVLTGCRRVHHQSSQTNWRTLGRRTWICTPLRGLCRSSAKCCQTVPWPGVPAFPANAPPPLIVFVLFGSPLRELPSG
jgi:hypothetical protein